MWQYYQNMYILSVGINQEGIVNIDVLTQYSGGMWRVSEYLIFENAGIKNDKIKNMVKDITYLTIRYLCVLGLKVEKVWSWSL